VFGEAEDRCGLPFGAATPMCAPIEYEVISDHEVTAVIPPGHGTVAVAVRTDGGRSPANPEAVFTYPPDRSPPGAGSSEPPLLLRMSCVVSRRAAGRPTGFCSSSSFTEDEVPELPTGPVTATLRWGRAVYASGSARVGRDRTHLFLQPVRAVNGGRYELVLSRPAADGGRRWSRRESVVLH
jgi:hypothetical protein